MAALPPRAADMRSGAPLLPTLMVLIAVPVLIGFGLWQLQRLQWKEALLADLARASQAPMLVLGSGAIPADAEFRKARLVLACEDRTPLPVAGRSAQGQPGYALWYRCTRGQGRTADGIWLSAGWAPRHDGMQGETGWPPRNSTPVEGMLVKSGKGDAWLLVASKVPEPWQPVAPPDPGEIPNNHLSYAIQWFSFAAILAVIYGLYVRRWRLAPLPGEG